MNVVESVMDIEQTQRFFLEFLLNRSVGVVYQSTNQSAN